jgi:AhpD family alkylhydroperoxidase
VGIVDRFLFDTVAPRQVRYIRPPDHAGAKGLARAAIDQMDREFVVGPPITIHISNPELMTGIWSAARECLAAGKDHRPRGEVIAATVSRMNSCPYCFDIHTSMLHSWNRHKAAESAWQNTAFSDPELRAAAEWAAATATPGSPILANPPFASEELPCVLGTAICFHYINRVTNIFLNGSAVPMKGQTWLRGQMVRMSGKILRPKLSSQRVTPGEFLIDAARELPHEFDWTNTDKYVSQGLARFASECEAAGEESVAPEVRDCVSRYVSGWSGETPALGRAWLENTVSPLNDEHKPAARVALLAAVSSWQMDPDTVRQFRKIVPRDRDLINTAAWGGYTAVRRIASWLRPASDRVADVPAAT